jgi:hypothetical protein
MRCLKHRNCRKRNAVVRAAGSCGSRSILMSGGRKPTRRIYRSYASISARTAHANTLSGPLDGPVRRVGRTAQTSTAKKAAGVSRVPQTSPHALQVQYWTPASTASVRRSGSTLAAVPQVAHGLTPEPLVVAGMRSHCEASELELRATLGVEVGTAAPIFGSQRRRCSSNPPTAGRDSGETGA